MNFLPPPLDLQSPELKPIPGDRMKAIASFAEVMSVIGDGGGTPPPLAIDELTYRVNAYRNNRCSLASVVETPNMARTFITVYSAKQILREAIPFTTELSSLLTRALSSHPAPLVRLFFGHYDTLDAYETLREFLLSSYKSKKDLAKLTGKNRCYVENASILFGEAGPRVIAEEAVLRGKSLHELATSFNMPIQGAFHDQAYLWYYVSHAQQVSIGRMTPVLKESSNPDIHHLPLRGKNLGHWMIDILVRRCIDDDHIIPEHWLTYILVIAGDPRVPATHQRFQKYWISHSPQVTKKVKASLARRDLKFFLDLLGQFAEEEGGDMGRMYPARRRFLEGFLTAKDAIEDALLILSPQGRDYIKSQLPPEERRGFVCSILTGNTIPGQSSIYLELPNGHLIEGSHQSCFRLYHAEAAFPLKLRNGRPATVAYPEITGSNSTIEQAHHKGVRWQYNILSHLAQYDYGVDIDPETALSESDYNLMIQKHGIPR